MKIDDFIQYHIAKYPYLFKMATEQLSENAVLDFALFTVGNGLELSYPEKGYLTYPKFDRKWNRLPDKPLNYKRLPTTFYLNDTYVILQKAEEIQGGVMFQHEPTIIAIKPKLFELSQISEDSLINRIPKKWFNSDWKYKINNFLSQYNINGYDFL